jgi:glucose-1-phosphate thymidylyltransferase
MKGIVLAGGLGTRLLPLTLPTSKQLLPVYDKPMIYYPISTLILAGIRQLLIITTPHEQDQFKRLLGDGSQWGIAIEYAIQEKPEGLAQALLIGEKFINKESVALILGDNIFYGPGMGTALSKLNSLHGCSIFGYEVPDPERFGVLSIGSAGEVLGIEEKPLEPKSNFVVPGLYFFDSSAVDRARTLSLSCRNELEIVDLLNLYLEDSQLRVEFLNENQTWLDTGTVDSLHAAAVGVREVQIEIGRKINVPEEIAWRLDLISTKELLVEADKYGKSGYGDYLRSLVV